MQMDQVRSQDIGEGINNRAAPPQEYYYHHAGLDRPAATTTGLSEANGVLVLMELLEEEEDEQEYSTTTSPPHVPDDDADRLSRVMRSLEAEIMRGGDNGECLVRQPGENINGGVLGLDDMLLDFDDAQAFGYYWPEAPVNVYSEGGVVGYEMQVAQEQQYYCADQCSGEQVYSSSLWE